MKPIDVTSDSYAEYNEDSNEKDPKFKIGAIHKGCPYIMGGDGSGKSGQMQTGGVWVVNQMSTSAWKKNYSYHICEIYSDNLAVCQYIKISFCLYSIENV